MDDHKPTRITKLSVDNYKRLRAIEITPDGNVVRITGKNAQGKSSLLDAIAVVLGGKGYAPSRPVRDGEERAVLVAELDNGLVVTRTFTATGGGSLIVESKDGARYRSPQAILDALLGTLSFDPLAFARFDPKKRLEIVREAAGVDVGALDGKRARAFEARTESNRDAKRLEAQLGGLPLVDGVPNELVDVAALAKRLEDAQAQFTSFGRLETQRERLLDSIRADQELAQAKRDEIARLKLELETIDRRVSQAHKEAAALGEQAKKAEAALPDIASIRGELKDVERVNAGVRRNRERRVVEDALHAAAQESMGLTLDIERLDEEKRATIAAAKLPVDGLS